MLQPDMSIIEQTHAALNTPAELPPLPVFIRPDVQPLNPAIQQQLLAQQHAERLQAVAAQYAQQQQQQQVYQQQLAAQNQQQQMQQGHVQQQQQMRAPSDGSVGHGSPAVNGQGMLPPQTNGRPPISKRPSSQNGNHVNGQVPQQGLPNVAIAQNQGQGRSAMSPTYPIQMNGSPQLANANAMMLPNGKPLIGPNGQIDPNMQRMLAARLAQQQQQQRQQSEDGSANSNPPQNANIAPAPGPNQGHAITSANAQHLLSQMTPEQAQQITQLAAKGGFGENIAGFLEHRGKAQQIQKAKQQRDQQAAVLQAQANANASGGTGSQRQPSNGSNSGNGDSSNTNTSKNNGNGSETFASPQLPSGSLNLKLPAHATARLGSKPQPSSPAQRAQ